MTEVAEKPVLLIVDDVASNIQLLANLLNHKYQVKLATDGLRAIELAKTSPFPDLILLDIEMPQMDGYTVCKQLKLDPTTSATPVIFITAKDNDQEEEYGLGLGAVDYITKPFRPAIVLARVNTQIVIKQQRDQLEKMALYDQFTKLYNRHYLTESAPLKIHNAIRHGFPLCIAVIDIDFFKSINDTHGHDIGDEVLQAIAQILKENTRQEDIAARIGGEEFVLLLDHCNLDSAISKVEGIRKKIEERCPMNIKVTASFGIANLDLKGDTFATFLKRADQAVYQAKKRGRNRIESIHTSNR